MDGQPADSPDGAPGRPGAEIPTRGLHHDALLALASLPGREGGLKAVARAIARAGWGSPSTTAVRGALDALVARGLLQAVLGDTVPERGHLREKLYVLTPAGSAALAARDRQAGQETP